MWEAQRAKADCMCLQQEGKAMGPATEERRSCLTLEPPPPGWETQQIGFRLRVSCKMEHMPPSTPVLPLALSLSAEGDLQIERAQKHFRILENTSPDVELHDPVSPCCLV